MSAAYALLGILGKQSSYGYDLKRDYDEYFGKEKPLAFGQVYATLGRLLRDRMVSAVAANGPSSGPERKLYAITPNGRSDLERWLKSPEPLHPDTQMVLFTKVVTSILLHREPYECLDAQRAMHIARMHDLTELRRVGDLAAMLRADYALFHLEADLRWIDLTMARIGQLREELQQ